MPAIVPSVSGVASTKVRSFFNASGGGESVEEPGPEDINETARIDCLVQKKAARRARYFGPKFQSCGFQ